MSQHCYLGTEPLFQCCCNCKHHWPDNHHCTTKPALRKKMDNKCICSVQKGWICVGMRMEDGGKGAVHSGWPKHSIGCEMYQPIIIKPRDAALGESLSKEK